MTNTKIQISLALLFAVFSNGCAEQTGPERSMPLSQLAHSAEILTETPLINIGTDDARQHLINGWSFNEEDRKNRSFVWSEGPESTLQFFLAEPKTLDLELRCRPFRFPGSPQQTLDLILNDTDIERIRLEAGFSDSRIELPAQFLVAGVNTITFRYGYSRRVSDVQHSTDQRELGVAWGRLRFFGRDTKPDTPRIEDDLTLPAGTGMGFFITNWNRLLIQSVKNDECDDCKIYITLRRDQQSEEILKILSPSDGATVINIPQVDSPVRLGFRCTGTGSGVITLVDPTLHGPEPDLRTTETPEFRANDRRPNILIYLVDALRRDRLGCYGSQLGLSPRIDEIAEQGWVFEQAFAQSSWTKPSVASLFTGVSPVVHSVNGKDHRLPTGVQTFAELLLNEGYQTAAFSTNAYISPSQGFGQGFETFEYAQIRARELNDLVEHWLNENTQNEDPFLLYIHTVDPHAPYDPAPEYRRRFAPGIDDPRTGSLEFREALSRGEISLTTEVISDLMSLYNAEVAENDAAFGELVDILEAFQLLDNTLIVFLSDHGEEFYEHQTLGHGMDLHDEVLSVPLVLHVPWHTTPRRIGTPVQHVDLLPTLLDVVGVTSPSQIEGRTLFRDISHPINDDRRIYSYLNLDGRHGIASTSTRWKLVLPLAGMRARRIELFDRSVDPRELHDIALEHPVIAGYEASRVRTKLEAMQRGALASESLTLGDAQRRDLEALGYLH